MNKSERVQKILEILLSEGNASTNYLANALGVSESTIRRDLNDLISKGSLPLMRVRGGVVYSLEKMSFEPMFELKVMKMVGEKKAIAKLALNFVENGDTIFLDSGTTIYYFAKLLGSKRGLKVVVVDIKTAEELSKYPNIKTILACGEVRPGYYTIGGTETIKFLELFRVDKAFIAADAWNLEGIFNSSDFEVEVKRKMIELARQKYLLADHSKYGRTAFIKVTDIDAFDAIITSKPLSKSTIRKLQEFGVSMVFPTEKKGQNLDETSGV